MNTDIYSILYIYDYMYSKNRTTLYLAIFQQQFEIKLTLENLQPP